MARRLLYTPDTTTSDKLVKVTRFRYNSRNTLSDAASGVIWTEAFTKEYDANTSWILMEGMIPGATSYSDQCGVYAGLNGMDTNNDTPRHHGVCYGGADNGSNGWARYILYIHRIIDNTDSAQELNAGSRTWSVGWSTRNGSAGDKPFVVVNPNANEDGRNQQYGSIMSIYEYLY